jgi:hypothetical protein
MLVAWLLQLLEEALGKLGQGNDPALPVPDNEPKPAPKPQPIRDPYGYWYRLNMEALAMIGFAVFNPDNELIPQPLPIADLWGYWCCLYIGFHNELST